MKWIKSQTEPGEYTSVDGKYKAVRAYHRRYGNASWNLFGASTPHVFPTFAELKKFADTLKGAA